MSGWIWTNCGCLDLEERDGLADRQTLSRLIAQPGDERDIAVGIEALISLRALGTGDSVASFPGAEGIGGNTGPLNNRPRVIHCIGTETIKQSHGNPPSISCTIGRCPNNVNDLHNNRTGFRSLSPDGWFR